MNLRSLALPSVVVAATVFVSTPEVSRGFVTSGFSLGLGDTRFRIRNNFGDPSANDNATPSPNFPGAVGATLAIWKGVVEWSSGPFGDGAGDPFQTVLGSGESNFDPMYTGISMGPGPIDGNVHSVDRDGGGGIYASTLASSTGWKTRYNEDWTWSDGPGNPAGLIDIQSVAAHAYGHAIGLGHSADPLATMYGVSTPGTVAGRSLAADDVAGIQSIYGHRDDSGTKPVIQSVTDDGLTLTLVCTNLTPDSNEVWFTRRDPTIGADVGDPIRVTGLTSSDGGTRLELVVPATAGPGCLLVKSGNAGHASTSAPHPYDPDLVPPPAPMITGLGTGTVEVLTPSGGEVLSVFGNDLLLTTDVRVNGNSLDDGTSFSGSFTIVDDARIDVRMPLAAVAGPVDLEVVAATGSDSTQVEIVTVSSPVLAIEQPDVQSAVGLDFATSAAVGDVVFLLFSPLLGPTTLPGYFDWEVGAGNPSAIFTVQTWTIGPKLWRKTHFGPFSGLTPGEMLHFEGWVLEAAQGFAAPWNSTNAISRTVLN